jgi:uncharacterized membrane protein
VIHLYVACLSEIIFLANLLPDISVLGILLFRQHKYWFSLYPFLALYASEGVQVIISRIGEALHQIRIRTILIGVIIFLGIGSPILTSIGLAQNVSAKRMNQEFRLSRPDQLMTTIRENLTVDSVVATPPREEWLARYISCFTGAYVVYVDRPKIRWKQLDIPSQEERLVDLNVLYSQKSSASDRLEVIEKYGITHIVSGQAIDSSLEYLVCEVHLATFFDLTFYVYRLKTV